MFDSVQGLRTHLNRAGMRLQISSDRIALSPDDAIPLALLANEAMTNAYKHAFPAGATGG